ncbi:MAG: betaine/proline/choline family ABC transporter ATP-binding protein [bacterium]|nr:betaine/proline/choline family ABC transporter ATP-binding protein [bacterium]
MNNQSIKLACKDLWKIYGERADKLLRQADGNIDPEELSREGAIAAVREVNLDVYEGEILVVMGLSGSGKSTLVRLMSRLIEPTHGGILFNDKDLLKVSDKELIEIRRHQMGMVFQHFALLPHLTVLNNVAFPLEIQGVSQDDRQKRALEIIERVGLGGKHDFYPRELSGGQQQRVGIARSLAVEPELWFLDEPFSALDPLIRREMQDEFLRLQNVLRITIVFITHDFEEAIRLADRVAIMKDGRIVQIGTPEELVVAPVDNYVEEFTRHVNRSKVLTARSIMSEVSAATDFGGSVLVTDRVEDIADRIERSPTPFAVHDNEGNVIGCIDRETIVDVLIGRKFG